MDNEHLLALIEDLRNRPSEATLLEFKENNTDLNRMGRLVSGIANAAALHEQSHGYVVWGIEDGTHKVVGTSFEPEKAQSKGQPLEFALAKRLSPSIGIHFFSASHPSGKVVVLQIPAADRIPVKYEDIAYLRIGSATPKLSEFPDREAQLLAKLRSFAWELGIAREYVADHEVLDLLSAHTYFRLTGLQIPTDPHEILNRFKTDRLIVGDAGGRWKILNLAAVLFANSLKDFPSIERKAIRVIEYGDKGRTSTEREVGGDKGYATGYEGLIAFLPRMLPTKEIIRRGLRTEVSVFPEIALREVLANALVHQDFTITGAGPMVEIFPDRVEITNPGIPLLETERFLDLPPRSRNEHVAALMRRMGICEERGSGIDKVIYSVELAQLPPPDFRVDGENTRVILFGPRKFAEMDNVERIRACYQHAALKHINGQGMTNATLRERFGIAAKNASIVSRVIKETLDLGLIKKSEPWNARTGYYLPFWA